MLRRQTRCSIESHETWHLAKALDTTVDYLLTGDPMKDDSPANANLYRRFQTLAALSYEDRTTVISVIDAIIAKRQVENAIKPIDQQAIS